MRAQIRGLDMAQRNAQDGISLIQTGEGALNETHSILQRMRELAVQSSNDSNTDADRQQIQKEMDQLAQEVARIGRDTEFNTQKLLNGNFSGTFQIGANEDQNLSLSIDDMRSFALGITGNAKTASSGTYTAGTTNVITDGTYTVKYDGSNYNLVNSNGDTVATSSDGLTFEGVQDNTETLVFDQEVKSGTVEVDTSGTSTATASFTNDGLQAGSYTFNSSKNALVDVNGNTVATTDDGGTTFKNNAGDTVVTFSTALGDGAEVEVGGVDVTSRSAANTAITTIQNAIDKVSTQRSALGAYQNRLEHTINNLGTSSQNLTAAESRIRDVDYALAA
jgi:flagellin